MDPTEKQELQLDGIADSVAHTQSIIDEEIRRLHGRLEHVVLGGISQGGSIALWTLIRHRQLGLRLGGFVATNTWLPFANNLKSVLSTEENGSSRLTSKYIENSSDSTNSSSAKFDPFIRETIGLTDNKNTTLKTTAASLASQIPVFMGHGVDDASVDIKLGREAQQVLSLAGFNVQWKEYVDADLNGHWFKIPEEMDDIYAFLSCLR